MTRRDWIWLAICGGVFTVSWLGRGLVCFGGWPQ